MDKFLRYEFFKTRGFSTKASGMQFLDQQGLRAVMEKYSQEIDMYKEQKVMDFEAEFDKHDEAKKLFLIKEKENLRAKRDEKKELLKQSMKSSMREEILQELAEEKETQARAELISKYNMFIPNTLNINMDEIREQFVNISKDISEMKIVLEPHQKDKLATLANQTTQIAMALHVIRNELQSISARN
ncbi:hypothetical protein EB118_02105 [bacterium]|nr:hypothetical protein [bacterium]NDC93903.1 hypothetical protein [bacterium]NDD83263.1 hypothetical protein [bacterium]NDG28881.1 hypothetical protein [bacterium]